MDDAYPNDLSRPDAESWGIAADAAGNVYVAGHITGAAGVDCVLIKYPPSYTEGALPEWIRTWDGGLGDDQNWTIALDLDGFIYVTGYSMQSHGGVQSADIVTMRYDSQGNLAWNRLYNGTGNGNENGYAIVVDSVTKNVYVTGTSLGTGSSTSRDIITIMYDAAGTEQWVRRYTGAVNGLNRGTSLALDAEGSVYVTGWSQGAGSIDYATIKYRPRRERNLGGPLRRARGRERPAGPSSRRPAGQRHLQLGPEQPGDHRHDRGAGPGTRGSLPCGARRDARAEPGTDEQPAGQARYVPGVACR